MDFRNFLMMCSGSNLHILQKSPSEWNKYAGIGGIVLFTAVLLHFLQVMPCLRFSKMFGFRLDLGFYEGLMIFNLDRYIVSSIKNG